MENRVVFYEKDHKYVWRDHILLSGTSFVKKFEQEFMRDYYLDRGALKVLVKDYAELKKAWSKSGKKVMTQQFIDYLLSMVDPIDFFEQREQLDDAWKNESFKAATKGTKYHLAREKLSYEQGFEINPFDGLKYPVFMKEPCLIGDNCSLAENLYDLPDGFYPELLIFQLYFLGKELMLCGQSDKVFIGTDAQGRYVDIDDYKTSKKITDKPMWHEDYRRPIHFKPPISHVPQSKFHKYELQLSVYGWMLEQHGYRVRHTGLTHHNKLLKTSYKKREVEAMVEKILAQK